MGKYIDAVSLTLGELIVHLQLFPLHEIGPDVPVHVNLIASFLCVNHEGRQIVLQEDPHRVCQEAERSELAARQLY